MGLYYVSKVVECHFEVNKQENNFRTFLNLKTLSLLCQVLFLLCRWIQNQPPSTEMFSKYLTLCGAANVQKLLKALNAPDLNLKELSYEMVIELLQFTANQYRELLKVRNSIEVSSLITKSDELLFKCPQSANSKILCQSEPSKIIYPSYLDTIKNTLSVIHLTITKIAWTLADTTPIEHEIRDFWYNSAANSLEYSIIGLHFNGSLHSFQNIPKSVDHTEALKQGIPTYFISVMAADFLSLNNSVKPEVGSSIIAGFLPFSIFPTLAHILSTILRRPKEALLHEKLGVIDKVEVLQVMQDALVSTARNLYMSNLDMCEACFDSMISHFETHGRTFKVEIPSEHEEYDKDLIPMVPCDHNNIMH